MSNRATTLWAALLFAVSVFVASACTSRGVEVESTQAPSSPAVLPTAVPLTAVPPTAVPPTAVPPTAVPAPAFEPLALVELLASDSLMGRDNNTEASSAARDLLLPMIASLAQPAFSGQGDAGFLQEFQSGAPSEGTNIVGVMPGAGELAHEFVMIGAHYDHLGRHDCNLRGQIEDTICNGAADNAAGVAAVLAIADAIAELDDAVSGASRRSVILALWDSEEDALEGSRHYASDPAVSLDATVVYINFDIQGAALTPSLAGTTLAIGAETGGRVLIEATARATDSSALNYLSLSLLFGQGRSDHASLAAEGVPVVFFTDATNGCYHTPFDDVEHLDAIKLSHQIAAAERLAFDMLTMAEPPVFDSTAPASSYNDAVSLLELVDRAEPDFDLLADNGPALLRGFHEDLDVIVAGGEATYDSAAFGVLVRGALNLVSGLAESECVVPQ